MTNEFSLIPTALGVRTALGIIHDKSPTFKKKNIDKWSRLGVQHRLLQDIVKGPSQCRTRATCTSQERYPEHVRWEVHESGKQNFVGLNICSNKDCSVCGLRERGKLADRLEMAHMQNVVSGGQGSFVTATMKSRQNPNQINILLEASKVWAKKIADYNSRTGSKISYVIARECTFSPNKPTTHFPSRYFYHAHAHGLFMYPREDVPKMASFHKLLERWWVKAVEKVHAGSILVLSGKTKGQYRAGQHMFQIVETTPDKLLSKYIAKHLAPQMEMSYGNIKEGKSSTGGHKGRSLEELKASILLTDNKYEKGMLCNWFKKMHKQKRFLESKERIDQAVEKWKSYRSQQYLDTHVQISLCEWLEKEGFPRSTYVSDSLLKVVLGDSAFLTWDERMKPSKYALEMDYHLSNEFFGTLGFDAATANHTELINARSRFAEQCRNFRAYLKKMYCDESRKYSLLDDTVERENRKRMIQNPDPIRFTLMIPNSLWNYLSSKKVAFPLLECVRRHVTCEAHFPRLKFVLEEICSRTFRIPSAMSKSGFMKIIPSDPTLTQGLATHVREAIAWALEEDYRHGFGYMDMIESMYEDSPTGKFLPTPSLRSKWIDHLSKSFKVFVLKETLWTLHTPESTRPDWIDELLQ